MASSAAERFQKGICSNKVALGYAVWCLEEDRCFPGKRQGYLDQSFRHRASPALYP